MQRVASGAALRDVDPWRSSAHAGCGGIYSDEQLASARSQLCLALEMRGPRTQSSPLAAARIMSSILTRISWADLRSSGVMPMVLPA